MDKQKTPQQEFIERQQAIWLTEKGQKVEPIFLYFKNTTIVERCLFLEPWGTWLVLEPQEVAVVVSFYPPRQFIVDIYSDDACIVLHCDEPTKVFDKDGNPFPE